MNVLFHDRLSDETVDQLPEDRTTLGRWLIHSPGEGEVFLNSVPVQPGDFLAPELSGRWRLTQSDGSIRQGKTFRYQQPEENEAESIRTMGGYLNELVAARRTWLEWLDVVPLVPGMSDEAEERPLDQLIRKLFGHLEAVCMKPRAHLHVEVERVPVAKARRLPAKAASYLASHTEDWERPLIRGVLPKRVLSEVRHDQIDIYENRVAARLVDHLVVYLGRRIRVIRKLIKLFQDKEDYSTAVGGTYLRQRRILELWGQSIDSNEGKKRADDTLKQLERLKYRLMGLMDSPLYRAVHRRTYVAPTLQTTNILANDHNYCRVAELWRAWIGSGYSETKTPADVHREAQELCRGINSFAMLLVVRALDQLGYEITEDDIETPLRRPGRWELAGHDTKAACVWDESGNILVETGKKTLTFLALPACLGAAGTDRQAQEAVDQVVRAGDKRKENMILLYIGDSDESRSKLSPSLQRRLHTVGNDPRTGLSGKNGFLPISPWDIGSVERVSRALRWFIDSTRFDSYPLSVDVPQGARAIVDENLSCAWLEPSDGGAKLRMRRPPRDFEWDLLKIEQLVEKAIDAYDAAVKEHERLSDELREAVRKGKTGTLNQQKKNAYQQKEANKVRKVSLEALLDHLVKARSMADALLVCPACGTKADPVRDFQARADGCFRCDCKECRTFWATHICGNGHRYPVMLTGEPVDADDSECGWEDKTYGSDLLSLPCRTTNGSWGFICPACGEISSAAC